MNVNSTNYPKYLQLEHVISIPKKANMNAGKKGNFFLIPKSFCMPNWMCLHKFHFLKYVLKKNGISRNAVEEREIISGKTVLCKITLASCKRALSSLQYCAAALAAFEFITGRRKLVYSTKSLGSKEQSLKQRIITLKSLLMMSSCFRCGVILKKWRWRRQDKEEGSKLD